MFYLQYIICQVILILVVLGAKLNKKRCYKFLNILSENGEALRKHYDEVAKTPMGCKSVPLFLQEVEKDVKEELDVGKDLFALKYRFSFVQALTFNKPALVSLK